MALCDKEKTARIFRESLTRISPKLNTYVCYWVKFGKPLNLNNPVTLNEKILWLKFNTYWNNDLVRKCADKYRVREYVEEMGCGSSLCELFGVYNTVDEIPWDDLPERFALKSNVGCGKNMIVNDSSHIDIEKAKKEVCTWSPNRDWLGYSEMQYKDIPLVMLMEECLSSKDGMTPVDYKFYCMNGMARYVMICVGRQGGFAPRYYYYDREWTLMPFTKDASKNLNINIPKPDGIEEAFCIAERLSKPFPFVRVDLYIVDGRVYFGELTFTPSAGLDHKRPYTTDVLLGNDLILPKEKVLS